ncbi:MAG: carbohydrate kinase [Actinomycetota bacterium]|nr:carbohydrate kinase [Actinomycetota bacterium]
MSNQVWVCGEVLIDLIPDGTEHKAVVGGGPANTAKALSKLGIATQFIDGISNDIYGQMAADELLADDVLLDYVKYSDKPTCLAIVSLSKAGGATYEFVIDDTATFDFNRDWLPDAAQLKPSLLHIGTLVTAIEPAASVLFEWAKKVAKVAPIVFDPNIRPAVMSDRTSYVKQVERWVGISSAVKVSDDDIYWLYPGADLDKVVNDWLELGPELVVVTFGDKGLAGYRDKTKVSVDAKKVVVADTVGAGDTVGAILVEAIIADGLDKLTGERLTSMLDRAARAAAITVSRTGAKPPGRDEI